eukprot:2942504-Amphidinium_carterae.1
MSEAGESRGSSCRQYYTGGMPTLSDSQVQRFSMNGIQFHSDCVSLVWVAQWAWLVHKIRLAVACHKQQVPQKWIGSSVALGARKRCRLSMFGICLAVLGHGRSLWSERNVQRKAAFLHSYEETH